MSTHPDGPGTERDDVERTETVPTRQPSDTPEGREDVESDPARDDRLGSDWSDEGGATPVGPATSAPGGVENEESKRQPRFDREREEAEGSEPDSDDPSRSDPADGEHTNGEHRDSTAPDSVDPLE